MRKKRPIPIDDYDLKSGHKLRREVQRKKTAGAGDGHLTAGQMSATDYECDARSSKDGGKPPLANRVYPLTDIEGENGQKLYNVKGKLMDVEEVKEYDKRSYKGNDHSSTTGSQMNQQQVHPAPNMMPQMTEGINQMNSE